MEGIMGERFRALLIEDHAELADATAALLHREGFDVRIALSGQEGLDAAPDFKPDLILCDLNLPDMPGAEVIRLIRSNPLNQDSYAAVLTAMSKYEIRELNQEAENLGVDEFIPKPLTTEIIQRLVSKLKRK